MSNRMRHIYYLNFSGRHKLKAVEATCKNKFYLYITYNDSILNWCYVLNPGEIGITT